MPLKRYYLDILIMDGDRLVAKYREHAWSLEDIIKIQNYIRTQATERKYQVTFTQSNEQVVN